jgi:hypothetical protein
LPAQLYEGLSAGWNKVYSLIGPAIGPIMAVLILAAIIWVAIGRRTK